MPTSELERRGELAERLASSVWMVAMKMEAGQLGSKSRLVWNWKLELEEVRLLVQIRVSSWAAGGLRGATWLSLGGAKYEFILGERGAREAFARGAQVQLAGGGGLLVMIGPDHDTQWLGSVEAAPAAAAAAARRRRRRRRRRPAAGGRAQRKVGELFLALSESISSQLPRVQLHRVWGSWDWLHLFRELEYIYIYIYVYMSVPAVLAACVPIGSSWASERNVGLQ